MEDRFTHGLMGDPQKVLKLIPNPPKYMEDKDTSPYVQLPRDYDSEKYDLQETISKLRDIKKSMDEKHPLLNKLKEAKRLLREAVTQLGYTQQSRYSYSSKFLMESIDKFLNEEQ